MQVQVNIGCPGPPGGVLEFGPDERPRLCPQFALGEASKHPQGMQLQVLEVPGSHAHERLVQALLEFPLTRSKVGAAVGALRGRQRELVQRSFIHLHFPYCACSAEQFPGAANGPPGPAGIVFEEGEEAQQGAHPFHPHPKPVKLLMFRPVAGILHGPAEPAKRTHGRIPQEAHQMQANNRNGQTLPWSALLLRMHDTNALLSRFEPISLDEMDSVKLQKRVDTKYVFSSALLPALLQAMLPDYRLLHVQGTAGTAYRTLYLDTTDHRHFQDHHNTRTFRNKVRYREYIGSQLTYLEVKRKTGAGRTDKVRMRVPGIPEMPSADQVRFIHEATGRREELRPALWNHFTRFTFVNRRAPERLTMDLDLTFSDPAKHRSLGDIVVAELKQERADRDSPFVRLMKSHGIRPSSMSKYCVGMLMLGRPVKHNAFKELMLRLERLRRSGHPNEHALRQ